MDRIFNINGIKYVLKQNFSTNADCQLQNVMIRYMVAENGRSKKDYEQEQNELRDKLLQLDEEITQQEEQAENIDRFIGKVKEYLDLAELPPAIFDDMVKAVYVHEPIKEDGERIQDMDISHDFIGIFPHFLLMNLQNGETA